MPSLKGKTIIITGASRGIGQAIALKLAAEGANIAVAAKDRPETLQTMADQIIEAGGQALIFNSDMCDHNEIKRVIEQTASQFGNIDALINNIKRRHSN